MASSRYGSAGPAFTAPWHEPRRRANLFSRGRLRADAVTLVDVVDHQRLELGGDGRPAQRAKLLAVHEHRGGRRFAGAGQGDADVGVLRLAGAIDDATHHCDVELL